MRTRTQKFRRIDKREKRSKKHDKQNQEKKIEEQQAP